MDNKFYISLEAAMLLKEKGYNEVTNAAWNGFFGEMRISPQNGGYRNLDYPDDIILYSAPTKAETIDWLESKGIVVEVVFDCNMQRWYFSIYKEEKTPWIKHLSNDTFPTRLEAEDAAIIRALKEITKL